MNLHTQRRALLTLEELESRWVPATLHFVNGTLSITNLTSVGAPGLQIFESTTIANQFKVQDGPGATFFTFTGVSNILVDADNGPHTVRFHSVGNTYTGNLTINAHNGNDQITVNNNTPGSILGNVLVTTATGNDLVIFGNPSGNTFGGNVTVAANSGNDTVAFTANTTFNGSMSITGAQNIHINIATFKGGLSIQDSGIGTSSVTMDGSATIGKFLNITGGSGADSLTIAGSVTVNGNTNITQGTGNDTFNLSSPSTFNGNFNYTEGAGNDSVSIADGQSFNGNASFNLGNGTDTFTLAGTTTSVSGNLTIQEGNGNNSITTGAAVFGNLIMQLGNGNDTILVNSTAAPGGLFSLNAGNGNSSVSLTPGAPTSFNITFNFGTGTDTLTLGGTASTISGSLLSQNPGGNVFDNSGGWTISSPWTSNF